MKRIVEPNMQFRPGLTLVELMVTVALVGLLVYLAGATMNQNELGDTRAAASDVVQLFRSARTVAARQNSTVVVTVTPVGAGRRGLVEARISGDVQCPAIVPAAAAYATLDYGPTSAGASPGIRSVDPVPATGFCVLPNGRIVDNATRLPLRPAGTADVDLAGKAVIILQYGLTDAPIALQPPYLRVEVPFNGLVRVPQRH